MSALLAYLQGLDIHDRLVFGAVFGLLAAFLTACAYIAWLERRNTQQLRDELALRRGFHSLKRFGWVPEDLQ